MTNTKNQSVVLHIPHASTAVPAEFRGKAKTEQIARELLWMTDHFTDELFDGNVQKIVAPVSRLVCDVERFRKDADEPMAARGMGAVYTHSHDCKNIFGPREREKILRQFYDPHHEKLTRAVDEILAGTPHCLVLDCHSFSGTPLPYEDDQSRERPDICLGADDFHTPRELKKFAEKFFRGNGFSVEIDSPYAGALVPRKFLGNDKRVRALMIEVNRDLYMTADGNALCARKIPGKFERIQQILREFIELVNC